jgi:hypothetical protein
MWSTGLLANTITISDGTLAPLDEGLFYFTGGDFGFATSEEPS